RWIGRGGGEAGGASFRGGGSAGDRYAQAVRRRAADCQRGAARGRQPIVVGGGDRDGVQTAFGRHGEVQFGATVSRDRSCRVGHLPDVTVRITRQIGWISGGGREAGGVSFRGGAIARKET